MKEKVFSSHNDSKAGKLMHLPKRVYVEDDPSGPVVASANTAVSPNLIDRRQFLGFLGVTSAAFALGLRPERVRAKEDESEDVVAGVKPTELYDAVTVMRDPNHPDAQYAARAESIYFESMEGLRQDLAMAQGLAPNDQAAWTPYLSPDGFLDDSNIWLLMGLQSVHGYDVHTQGALGAIKRHLETRRQSPIYGPCHPASETAQKLIETLLDKGPAGLSEVLTDSKLLAQGFKRVVGPNKDIIVEGLTYIIKGTASGLLQSIANIPEGSPVNIIINPASNHYGNHGTILTNTIPGKPSLSFNDAVEIPPTEATKVYREVEDRLYGTNGRNCNNNPTPTPPAAGGHDPRPVTADETDTRGAGVLGLVTVAGAAGGILWALRNRGNGNNGSEVTI